jgi:hypoxanthine-DNA glycosylase
MSRSASFEPLARPGSRVLILGTLPGAESLRRQQYYANPHNAFWRIMGALFGAGPDLPYEQRLEKLAGAGVALWDVCASATRPGSLDANITEVAPQDFAGFLADHPHIALIGFNGQPAARLFRRFVVPDLPEETRRIATHILPSTSPAHAAMRFEQKLALWRDALRPLAAN